MYLPLKQALCIFQYTRFSFPSIYGGGLTPKVKQCRGISKSVTVVEWIQKTVILAWKKLWDMSDRIAELAKRIIASGYEYSGGGKIHIKPENRGKFTALKERTGHSATWFKEHGTPSQKKMATFALNSRHWRHENGGFLHTYNEGYQLGQTYDLSEEEVNELIRQGYEVERV